MIRTCESYSDDQLWQLLQGNDEGPSDSADHLAECSNCQPICRIQKKKPPKNLWSLPPYIFQVFIDVPL